jgi:hypothetical protein
MPYFQTQSLNVWNVQAFYSTVLFKEVVKVCGRNEIWIRFQMGGSLSHFEEAVENDDEFLEIGRKSSARDIFLTLATDYLTEAPAGEHLFQN